MVMFGMTHNYIALYKMLPQYSNKTSKSKCDSRLNKISDMIKGEFIIQQVGQCQSFYVPSFWTDLPGHKS